MALVRFGDLVIDWTTVFFVEISGFKPITPEHGSLILHVHLPGGGKSSRLEITIKKRDIALQAWEYAADKANGLTVVDSWAIDLNRVCLLEVIRHDGPFEKPTKPDAAITFAFAEEPLNVPIPPNIAEAILKLVSAPSQTV